MPKLEIGMHINRGFTLIEILVVITIASIIASFAWLAFGDFGSSRNIISSAEHFASYVKLIQQIAILESNTFGIKLNQNHYDTYRLEPGNSWVLVPKRHVIHRYSFPEPAIITIKHETNHAGPDIVIDQSGNMTAFQMTISNSQTHLLSILGYENGTLEIKKPAS